METSQPHFRSQGWQTVFIGALIGCLTFAAFWPMLGNGFIRYDDADYVTGNPHVLGGLSWTDIAWAFRSGEASNWHPITWLSHMADVQVIGCQLLASPLRKRSEEHTSELQSRVDLV